MLTIAADPTLGPAARTQVLASAAAELLKAAEARLDADEVTGYDRDVARDRLVRTSGAGRLVVDAELYAELTSDDGLVVVDHDTDDDLQPAPKRRRRTRKPQADTPPADDPTPDPDPAE